MYVVNKKKKKKKKFNFIVFLNFLLFFCIVISVGLGVNYIVKNAPVFDKRNLYMSQSTIMLDKNGNEITRLGADIKIKCLKCKREVMIPRIEFNKKLKKIIEE